ncbi:arsenate reductase (glutaredoxin) [Hansschlegelia sp. KR7-227]|jgi:arsenate reductase|uniref:arsenate reductase (glutaredoxin) n=1 Tax=Hansschlegelia sp. KR7-227 TaxID=3400914 RepID=UPI003C0DE3A8
MTPSVTIWHNPGCGTSRNTLAMIRAAGIEPTIVEYLKTPPTRDALVTAIASAGLTVREAARQKGTPFAELGLDDPSVSDDRLLDAMLEHPILINRPFVFTARGVRLCRPSETVLEILPAPLPGDFTKEDGEVVPAERR